jgi:hypothetical protein
VFWRGFWSEAWQEKLDIGRKRQSLRAEEAKSILAF